MTTVLKQTRKLSIGKSVTQQEFTDLSVFLKTFPKTFLHSKIIPEIAKKLKTAIQNKNAVIVVDNKVFDLLGYFSKIFNVKYYEDVIESLLDMSDGDYCTSNFEVNLFPHTCGIVEIGNYTIKDSMVTFLELLIFKELGLQEAFGMITTTFVDDILPMKDVMKYLDSELPPNTKIHFKNPKTGNKLTTYIWI